MRSGGTRATSAGRRLPDVRTFGALAVLALVFTAACDGSAAGAAGGATEGAAAGAADGAAAAPAARDSAGVRILEYPPLGRWNADVALEERVRIGAAEGADELLFSAIVGGLIRPDGSLVLVDRGTHEVRRFGADGAFLGRHGREGQGPGEYEFIRGTGRCAASGFTVFDIDWTRSVYDEDGRFVEERPTRLADGLSPYNLACDRIGRMAVVNWDLGAGRPPIGFHVAMARLRILDGEGRELADLGERIGSERFGRPTGSGPHPAGRATRFAFLDGDLIVADGTFFGFERWSPEGRLREIVRIDIPPPDADSLMRAYLEDVLERAPDDETRRRLRQSVEEMGTGPERASYLSALHVSGDRILVREPVVGRSGRWFEFAVDGTPLGFLPLPAGAELLDARGDLLLVEERGALDVPAAVVYGRVR